MSDQSYAQTASYLFTETTILHGTIKFIRQMPRRILIAYFVMINIRIFPDNFGMAVIDLFTNFLCDIMVKATGLLEILGISEPSFSILKYYLDILCIKYHCAVFVRDKCISCLFMIESRISHRPLFKRACQNFLISSKQNFLKFFQG